MKKAMHFINRQEGIGLVGLEALGNNKYRSCCWAINPSEASEILGGWLYLHGTKAAPSTIGGIVLATELADRLGKSRGEGYAITFEAKPEGRGQEWRGADHAMAWSGGVIEATLGHEGGGA